MDRLSTAELKKALLKSWSRETSSDPENWPQDNPGWGQCAVTALVVQDFQSGEIRRLDLTQAKNPRVAALRYHYFNNIDQLSPITGTVGIFCDMTYCQFSDEDRKEIYPENSQARPRDYLLSHLDTKIRYKKLRYAVARELSGNNPIFDNQIFERCLLSAMDSNCQKGRYGCVVTHKGQVIAVTCNRVLEPLKDWCEPECIRKCIPSRTESSIGCCDHAEERAVVVVGRLGVRPEECEFYAAGFRSNGEVYIKPEADFSCIRCAQQLYMHTDDGKGKIFVPVKDRWNGISTKEALETAKLYARKEKILTTYKK